MRAAIRNSIGATTAMVMALGGFAFRIDQASAMLDPVASAETAIRL